MQPVSASINGKSGGNGVFDLGHGIPELEVAPRDFLSGLLNDMIGKGFTVVDNLGSDKIGRQQVWHLLRWLGYDMTELEVKYLAEPPRGSNETGDGSLVSKETVLKMIQKLIALHHNFEMLQNVVA